MRTRSEASSSTSAAQDPQKLQEKLQNLIPKIFDDAQTSISNHRKNVVRLHKLQLEAAACQQSIKTGNGEAFKLVGEGLFNTVFLHMVNRVVEVKKGVRQADNIGRFIGEFVKHINEKALEDRQEAEDGDEDEEEETTAGRFTARLLKHLFPSLSAEKVKRYRGAHILSEMISHLGEVDGNQYNTLKSLLIGRLTDKDAGVRMQAAQALCKLCRTDDTVEPEADDSDSDNDSDEDEDDEPAESKVIKISSYLIDSMRHDPSAEVRREIVANIPVSSDSLPFLIERARDTDTTIRKRLYKRLHDDAVASVPLPPTEDDEPEPESGKAALKKSQTKLVMNCTHPRALSIQQREEIIRYGLRDREPGVKAAATKLLVHWVDIINIGPQGEEELTHHFGSGSAAPSAPPTDDDAFPVKKEEDDEALAARALGGDEELTDEEKKATGRILDFLGILDLTQPVTIQEDDEDGEGEEEERGHLGRQEQDSLAAEALLGIFAYRPDLHQNLKFVGSYWNKLTPETAFLARVFVDHCKVKKENERLSNMLPDISSLAPAIKSLYHKIIKNLRFDLDDEVVIMIYDDDEEEQRKEGRRRWEQTLIELLKIAVSLDYGDEIGRKLMHTLMRDMLSQEDLPILLVPRCLDLLAETQSSKMTLIRTVAEIIQDLRTREPEGPFEEEAPLKESYDSASARRRRWAALRAMGEDDDVEMMSGPAKTLKDQIELRCLDICIGMLERVNGTTEKHSTLTSLVKTLIVPNMQRQDSLILRRRGMVALGLSSLISMDIAPQCMHLYVREYRTSQRSAIKSNILKVIFDAIGAHGNHLLKVMLSDNEGPKLDLIAWFTDLFKEKEHEHPKVMALLAMGLAKLVLAGRIEEPKDVLTLLVLSYFSEETVSNQELRQCLTHFFQFYCYSSHPQQKKIQEVFVGAFLELSEDRRKLSEDEISITSAKVAGLFLTWTDPTKLVVLPHAPEPSTSDKQKADFVHLDLAMDIFKVILKPNHYSKAPLEKDDTKVLYQLLPKLYLPDSVDADQIRQLRLVMDRIPTYRPFRDATTRNAYNKFRDSILKKYEQQLEEMTEENFRKLEMYSELFAFLDDIIPLDDDEAGVQTRNKSRKRRSCSIITHVTETGSAPASAGSISGRGQPRAKRPRLSTSNGDDSDVVETSPPPPAIRTPPTARPRRVPPAAVKKMPINTEVIEISSDDDEDFPTSQPPIQPMTNRRSPVVKQEPPEKEDEEDGLEPGPEDTPEPENTFDSIMDSTRRDSDSEDDEDEVNDLLAGGL